MWQLVLENGAYKLTPGDEIQEVDCTMNFDSVESFVRLQNGDLSPIKAYTSGKVKFSGNRKLIQEVGKIIPLGKKK
ncbi:MAG: hypothetical protein RBG13Loki_0541 [Promethearchaeota archaeon CR_4]|nr:MAG: hypothetical protein RBG13Loki_0541 [Candidatus Lokiarchaeota archaeon CR_4]